MTPTTRNDANALDKTLAEEARDGHMAVARRKDQFWARRLFFESLFATFGHGC